MPSPLLLYGALGALLIIAGLAISLKVQTHRLASTKAEYATFVAQTKALGEIAQVKADKQNADFKLLKETVDREITISLLLQLSGCATTIPTAVICPALPQAPNILTSPVSTEPTLTQRLETSLDQYQKSLLKASKQP